VVETSAEETGLDTFLEPPEALPQPIQDVGALPELPAPPEAAFAARTPLPEPPRAFPSVRRAIFFDVENTSRAEHIARVLDHLAVDRIGRATELVAVGNWRVIGHDTARLLARQGAHLVHSAPSVGVRDWSDLRIAVAAGVWLAAARPGDAIEIVSDDQAFDAVGDVAMSLGVAFHRLSYRALAGIPRDEVKIEEPAGESRSRRRRRGGRRGRREGGPSRPLAASPPPPPQHPMNGSAAEAEPHTAPHDEIVAVVRDLLGGAHGRPVSIDALSNALKARGFRRPPGSLRLITRLRRIKELAVSRNGAITLMDAAPPDEVAESPAEAAYASAFDIEPRALDEGGSSDEPIATSPGGGTSAAPEGGEPDSGAPRPRRRRRRGGRRRRGRGGGASAVAAP
jgi:hypothetical protein